jgi:hypothetical protein
LLILPQKHGKIGQKSSEKLVEGVVSAVIPLTDAWMCIIRPINALEESEIAIFWYYVLIATTVSMR